MDQPLQVSEPRHHFREYLVRPNPIMFNNVDTTHVVTNTNREEETIPPGYYTIGEVIAILNTLTHTTFSISP